MGWSFLWDENVENDFLFWFMPAPILLCLSVCGAHKPADITMGDFGESTSACRNSTMESKERARFWEDYQEHGFDFTEIKKISAQAGFYAAGGIVPSQRQYVIFTVCHDRAYLTWQTSGVQFGSHRNLHTSDVPEQIFPVNPMMQNFRFCSESLFTNLDDCLESMFYIPHALSWFLSIIYFNYIINAPFIKCIENI